MNLKVIVSLGILVIMGFLLYPRNGGQRAAMEEYEWITATKALDNEPLRGAKLRKDNPVVKTYDLGYIYKIDRAEIIFSGIPKDYDILVSSTGNEYYRAISALPASREYYYPVITFPPKEARWVQVVVNDWYGTQPKIESTRIGARYISYSPVKDIRTKYNPGEAYRLIDGLKHEDAPKWIGGKRVEREVEKDKKVVKEITYESPGRDDVEIIFDMGAPKRIYGIAVTTGGNENNLKQYKVSISVDGRSFQQVYVSRELENKITTDSYIFANAKGPIQPRYIRLAVSPSGWYGKYPEIREVEIYTDEYHPSGAGNPIEEHNAIQVYYDNCGLEGTNLVQGFPFDRGSDADPRDRYLLRPEEEVDPKNSFSERSFCYHYDRVIFSYSNLDPAALYWVQVTYLQEKNGKRIQSLDVDGILLHDSMEIPANLAKKYIFPIPPETYADGEIKLHFNRLAGPNAVVSEVAILQASSDKMPAGEAVFAKASSVATPVVIDGVLDEWPDIFPLIPQQYSSNPLNSPCYMYVQWDSENLFIAFKANTNSLTHSPTHPLILHVFVDAGLTKSPGMYKTGDHHFRFLTPGTPASKVLASQIHHYLDSIPNTVASHKEVEAATSRTAAEYVLEARIPKDKVLYGFSPLPGSVIGFNYLWSSPYAGELSWAAANANTPPVSWGELELVGTVRGQVAIAPLNPSSSTMDLRELANKPGSFKAGQDLILAVWDPDRNTDRNSPQSIKVRVSGNLTNDTKEIRLSEIAQALKIDPRQLQSGVNKETGFPPANNSDLFAGKISTGFATTPNSDPFTLGVQGKEVVTLYYLDPYYGPNQTNVEVSANASVKVGTTGTISIISQSGAKIEKFNAGDKLFFRVEDKDLLEEETASIAVTVASGTDTEKVTLADEKKSGTFTGSIETKFGSSGVSDGVLQVMGNETIEAIYLDSIQATGNTNVTVEDHTVVNTGSTGILIVGKSRTGNTGDFTIVRNFSAGDNLLIFVRDGDINTNPNAIEQVNVRAEGNTTNDSVTLALKETEPDSDTFSGVLYTVYSLMADKSNNALEVNGGEVITVTYEDALQSTGATAVPVSESVAASVGSDGVLAIMRFNYLWDLEDFNAGDTLYFKLEDPDLNNNPGVKDRADISLVSEETHDNETVALEEMSPNAGTFVGSMVTNYSGIPITQDHILQVRGGERVTALYLDALRSTGETNVPITDSCRVNAGTAAKITIYSKTNLNTPIAGFPEQGWRNKFRAGETLIIRLEDMDLNTASTAAEIFQVNIVGELAGDQVPVTLTEVSGSAGVFNGEVKTEYGVKAVPGDGILQVQGEEKISISYLDAINDAGETNIPVSATLTLETGRLGTIQALNAVGSDAIISFNAGDSFVVRVRDGDLNTDPNTVNKVTITAKGNRLGDQVQIALQENKPDSGVFDGIVQSAQASNPDPQDAVLQVTEKEIVTLTYVDALVATGETNVLVSVELIVRSGTAGSLLIVDENRKELPNFNAGRKLYFILDDFVLSNVLPNSPARITVQTDGTQAKVLGADTPGKDREEVMLEEMAGERGIYTGSISTSYGATPVQDGILQVQGGEEVRAIYNSQIPETSSEPIIDSTYVNKGYTSKITILGANGIKSNNFNAGDKLYFKLEDLDLNLDATTADKAEIWVAGDAIASGRRITLNETGIDSGVFTGSIDTRYGRGMPGASDILEVVGGEQVTAVYYDALTSSGETDVKVTDNCMSNMLGTATYAPGGVVIDGSMAGWPLENALRAGDEGSNLYIQWDMNNLYILAYVVDPEVVVPDATKFWEGADALEIHIDTDPTSETSMYLRGLKKPSYYFFWFCPKGAGIDGNSPYVGQNMPETVYDYTTIETSVRIFPGSRYVLEARIPFDPVLGGFNYKTAKTDRIGFNYIIRRSNAPQLRWAAGSETEPDLPPSFFGTLLLRQP